ncbi:DUF4114 domain-containing protein [Enterovibrio coralii]|uniref:DUF4114 domain-containing protein n=1 Tax=Enterovibrio coralii TaxID=294935 RepID=A0A135IDH6_9GAMM|nr:DUF4114 domain-containing protein [Enterovibrio coralii]KXF83512.1 hypothetical protein ATN88_16705 [Enterovibrio coralii]
MKYAIGTSLIASSMMLSVSAHANIDDPFEYTSETLSGMTNQSVDASILQTVDESLPEARNVNADFLNPAYDPYLTLSEDASVSVTFLDEGAGYRNSLGYFSFGANTFDGLSKGDIDTDSSGYVSLSELQAVDGVSAGFLFPNASNYGQGGVLLAGDTVDVAGGSELTAGTSLGFFLNQNAWKGTGVETGDAGGSSYDTQSFYSLDFLNPEASATSTMLSDSSDSRHVAMLFADSSQEQVILGFEDLNRVNQFTNDYNYRSDEDFNDAVFTVSSTPSGAFGGSNIATAPLPPMAQSLIGLAMFAGLISMARKKAARQEQQINDHQLIVA